MLYPCCTHGQATAIAATPSKRKRKVQWYYYHLHGSHWMIHYSLQHPSFITILIAHDIITNGHTLSLVYQVIYTNMTPSYKAIHSITILYVYAWNNSVVNILGGIDGHRHDNKFNKGVDIIQHIILLLLFRCMYQHNHIQQSTTTEEGEGKCQRTTQTEKRRRWRQQRQPTATKETTALNE